VVEMERSREGVQAEREVQRLVGSGEREAVPW